MPWDLAIFHPPCTHLATSGARWFKDKVQEQQEAIELVQDLLKAPIPHIALENPISILSTYIRKPDQIVQPWMFGHGEVKATCFWLKNLPLLRETKIVSGGDNRIHMMPDTKDRGQKRSISYTGIASATALQWGSALLSGYRRKRLCRFF